jgi:hypothetical protein
MSECAIYVLKFFQNAFAVSRPSFIADTTGRLNAVKHFPNMSLNMRRLESNVCCFTRKTCESFIELRCRIDEGILVSV